MVRQRNARPKGTRCSSGSRRSVRRSLPARRRCVAPGRPPANPGLDARNVP